MVASWWERFDDFILTHAAMRILEPHVLAAAEEAFLDEAARTDLLNFANEIRSRLQRIDLGI